MAQTIAGVCWIPAIRSNPPPIAGTGWSDESGTIFSTQAGRDSTGKYNTTLIKIGTPVLAGTPINTTMRLSATQASGAGATVTLRWALCTSDVNKDLYLNTAAAVTDPYQMAFGTVTLSGLSSTAKVTAFSMNTFHHGMPFYLYLWAYSTTYGTSVTISPAASQSATLYYTGNIVKLYVDGEWGNYQCFIYDGGWVGYKPYVYNGGWVEYG